MSDKEKNIEEFAALLRGMTADQFQRFLQAIAGDLIALYAPEGKARLLTRI
jgi:hypothetical protein